MKKSRLILLLAVLIPLVIVLLFTGYTGYKDSGDDGLTGHARFIRDFIALMLACLGLSIAGIRSHAVDKQAETDSKRQSAETFAKSVELLASNNQDKKPAIESRIGGIYALEKLASADAENYAAPVMKMLVTYIQENAQKTALPVASKESDEETTTDPDKRKKPAHLGKDVKTAFAALKRLHDSVLNESGLKRESPDELSFAYADFRALRMNEIKWIDMPVLRNAQLQDSDLSDAQLRGAELIEAQLQSANLSKAQLQDAKLIEAQLQNANFSEAELQEANLSRARLQGANFIEAALQEADLSGARLQGANFYNAELQEADLSGARLQGADLGWARLTLARLQSVEVEYTLFIDTEDLDSVNGTNDTQNWKVWHSDQPFFVDNEIESLKDNSQWNLEPILEDIPEESQKAFLQGVLRNFTEMGIPTEAPIFSIDRAEQCRLAVRRLQHSHPDLWDALDFELKKWLEELDEDGLLSDEREDDK